MEKCKFCEAQLEEGATLCPACGKDNAEEKTETVTEPEAAETAQVKEEPREAAGAPIEEKPEAKPEEKKPLFTASPAKIALAAVALVLLVALLVTLVMSGMDRSKLPQPDATQESTVPTDATQATTAATVPADGNPDDETCKGSYSADDDAVIAAADTVVATAGDQELTLSMLQVYYWQEVSAFVQQLYQYGMDTSYVGLDLTKPLDTQTCTIVEGRTWQQHFLVSALNSWQTYKSLDAVAGEAGYELEQEYVDYLATMPETMETEASTNGYISAQQYLEANIGAAATIEDYVSFMEVYYHGYSYFNHLYSTYEPTDEEVEAMFAEHEEEYAANGLTKETKTVNIRHVLIMPEGATSENIRTETFPEEAWAASEKIANDLLAQWLTGDLSEESFAELAKTHSQDGSASNGGLYTGVTQGQMVAAFNDWCFDPERKVGDYGLVETEFGYHLMFYSGENFTWFETVKTDVINDYANKLVEDAVAAYPLTVDYSKILLCRVPLT